MAGSERKSVAKALEHLDDAIAATQLGITFASLALGWIGEPALAHLLAPLFHGLPEIWGLVLNHALAVSLAYLLLTYLHVVLGELAPKAIALQRAEDVALIVTGPLLVFSRIFRPFILFMNGSGNWVVRLLRLPPPRADQDVHSLQELGMLVEETAEAGMMATDQAEYVRNVFRLSGKRVRDVMVPREKVVTLSLQASPEEVLATCRETAHTRMPVWEGDPDNIVGIVNTKNLFHLFSQFKLVLLEDAMYPPIFADSDQSVGRLLGIFRRERRPMAVVRDADGQIPRHRHAGGHPRGDRRRDRGRARRAAAGKARRGRSRGALAPGLGARHRPGGGARPDPTARSRRHPAARRARQGLTPVRASPRPGRHGQAPGGRSADRGARASLSCRSGSGVVPLLAVHTDVPGV